MTSSQRISITTEKPTALPRPTPSSFEQRVARAQRLHDRFDVSLVDHLGKRFVEVFSELRGDQPGALSLISIGKLEKLQCLP